jgi:hypothetical protein
MDEPADAPGDSVRERASVARYEPPVYDLDEPMWVAEDDETNCVGVGRVEAEAVGNLLAVVDAHGHEPTGWVKLPGQTVERTWEAETSLLDRLWDRL